MKRTAQQLHLKPAANGRGSSISLLLVSQAKERRGSRIRKNQRSSCQASRLSLKAEHLLTGNACSTSLGQVLRISARSAKLRAMQRGECAQNRHHRMIWYSRAMSVITTPRFENYLRSHFVLILAFAVSAKETGLICLIRRC